MSRSTAVNPATGPSVAITIGAYKAVDFIRLNIAACRRVFGDSTPILISDDHSAYSESIQALAGEEGCAYQGSSNRRSHCSGDWQAFINGCVFARSCGADVAIKLSQRFVPVDHRFKDLLLSPFSDPNVAVVYPSQMSKKQLARPGIKIYSMFSMLTDCFAWRASEVNPEMLLTTFVERQMTGDKTATVPEFAWRQIVDRDFPGRAVGVEKLSNPVYGETKCYLRKASAKQGEYHRLAVELGLDGGNFDLREWSLVEGAHYLPRPVVMNE